jgi:hypothetical protein
MQILLNVMAQLVILVVSLYYLMWLLFIAFIVFIILGGVLGAAANIAGG